MKNKNESQKYDNKFDRHWPEKCINQNGYGSKKNDKNCLRF